MKEHAGAMPTAREVGAPRGAAAPALAGRVGHPAHAAIVAIATL